LIEPADVVAPLCQGGQRVGGGAHFDHLIPAITQFARGRAAKIWFAATRAIFLE
jgi:hypothetical protein